MNEDDPTNERSESVSFLCPKSIAESAEPVRKIVHFSKSCLCWFWLLPRCRVHALAVQRLLHDDLLAQLKAAPRLLFQP